MTTTEYVPRRAGEPEPDLIDYRIVHRAMSVDLDRLATAAAELVERPDPRRMADLRTYLRAVSAEIVSHHRVEDEHVWPFLEAIVGERAALLRLTDDHENLDPPLHRALGLAARNKATRELADTLAVVSELLTRHVLDEERDVFPLIREHVSVADYRRLQRRFRAGLSPRLLRFVVPWVVGHATEAERPRLLAEAGWPMRVMYALFERRFRARAARLFGRTG